MMDFITDPQHVLTLFLVVCAPFVGSFLANFAVRWPEGESVVSGRSGCRSCAHRLGGADLIPIASWLMLGGRCRYCGASISPVYPLTEGLAVLVALWAALSAQDTLVPVSILLAWVLLTLAVVDLRCFLLPDMLTLPLIPLGLVLGWLMDGTGGLVDSLAGALLGGGLSAIVALVYRHLRKIAGLGWGDVKLLAAAGAWTGVAGVPMVLFLGAGFGLGAVVVMRLAGRSIDRHTALPFGPFLTAGFWIVWLYGPFTREILAWGA